MTRLQRLQRRLHDIRLAGGSGSIRQVNGFPFLVYTMGNPETVATRMFSAQPQQFAQTKAPTPA